MVQDMRVGPGFLWESPEEHIYIYMRGTGWQAGENYDTDPNWTSLTRTGHRPCRTPLVTAWPGLRQVGAKCGLSVVVSLKSEAVCHQLRATPVLGHSASKTTFSVISTGTRPQLSRKGGAGWSWGLRELDTNGSSFEGNHDG